MELRHLRYVLAVAGEGSFTRAAAALHLAQQALSQQVADLERELGVKIFERLPRGVRPTPAGAVFLEEARLIVAESEHAIAEARRVARAGTMHIRVGYLSPPVPVANEIITRFRDDHPTASIELDLLLSREQASALQHGRIDIGLAFAPPGDEPGIVGEVVAEAPFSCAVLPESHPLASRESVWLRELESTPMLLPEPDLNPYLSAQMEAALNARGVRFARSSIRLHGPASASLVAVANAWLLWFEGAESAPGTVCRRINDPPLSATVWLLSRRDDPSAVVRHFVHTCREMVRESGSDVAAAVMAADEAARALPTVA